MYFRGGTAVSDIRLALTPFSGKAGVSDARRSLYLRSCCLYVSLAMNALYAAMMRPPNLFFPGCCSRGHRCVYRLVDRGR